MRDLHDAASLNYDCCYAYVHVRRHRQVKVVGEIFSVRFDLAGDLVFLPRIAKIDGRIDTTNLGERHFCQSVDHRLLVIATILITSSRGRSRQRSARARGSTGDRILSQRSAKLEC